MATDNATEGNKQKKRKRQKLSQDASTFAAPIDDGHPPPSELVIPDRHEHLHTDLPRDRQTDDLAEKPLSSSTLGDQALPLIQRAGPSTLGAAASQQGKEASECNAAGKDEEPQALEKSEDRKGKKAEPVLPWMRLPIRIEAGQGVPLADVSGLELRLRQRLEACEASHHDEPVSH